MFTNTTPRKPYHKPELEVLGDVRSLTLGGSFGTGESGNPVRKVKAGFVPRPGEFLPPDPSNPGDLPPPPLP